VRYRVKGFLKPVGKISIRAVQLCSFLRVKLVQQMATLEAPLRDMTVSELISL